MIRQRTNNLLQNEGPIIIFLILYSGGILTQECKVAFNSKIVVVLFLTEGREKKTERGKEGMVRRRGMGREGEKKSLRGNLSIRSWL